MTEPQDVIAYKEGVRLFKEGKVLEALEKFRFAAETGEDRTMEHFALAAACMQIGDKDRAEREYTRFLDMEPCMPHQEHAARKVIEQLKRERLEADALEEEHRRAREEKVRRERLEGVRRLYNEAVAFFRGGGYDSALRRLETLADSWGRTAEVLNLMALCHKHLGNTGEATTLLKEAFQQAPENVDVMLNLAQHSFDVGVFRAQALIGKVLELDPENPRAWYNRGVLALAEGRLDAAREAWEKAAGLDPADERVRANLELVSKAPAKGAGARRRR